MKKELEPIAEDIMKDFAKTKEPILLSDFAKRELGKRICLGDISDPEAQEILKFILPGAKE